MNAELYIKKAALLTSKGEPEKAAETMAKAIEVAEDTADIVQARCFLGEYCFVNQDYKSSKDNLEWIVERQEELEADYDDLLSDEIDTANILLEIIQKFSLI